MIDLKSKKIQKLISRVKNRCISEGLHKIQLELAYLKSGPRPYKPLMEREDVITCYEIGIAEYKKKLELLKK